VFIAVAGRSNALAGMVDANTPPGDHLPAHLFRLWRADLYSSLRMPGGVAPLVILEPSGAALAATKILALAMPPWRSVSPPTRPR
jgi:phosphoribosylcarboxyaminoimidazole (NCAIR) mutase